MNTASIVLFILIAILLTLILSVLFYRPRPVTVVHPSPAREKDPEEMQILQENLDLTERMIRLRWPYSTWLMEFIHLDDCLLMHWQGLSQSEKAIVFYVSAERTLQMIMEAVSRFNSDHDQPAYSFWIALPARYEDSYYASAQVRRFFLDQGIPVECVYCDGDGLYNCFGRDADTAFVSFGTKAMAEFKMEGDASHIHGCREALRSAVLAPEEITPVSIKALKQLQEHMPWRMRMILALPYDAKRKTVAAAALFPFAKNWFNAEISFYEDTFILQAVNEQQKEAAIAFLHKTAEKYGVSLKLKAERNTSSLVSEAGQDALCTLIRETTGADYILPVLRNDIYTPHFRGLAAVFFSPMRTLREDSAEKAIRYYYAILTSKPTSQADKKKDGIPDRA